jgi:hypothetical protein
MNSSARSRRPSEAFKAAKSHIENDLYMSEFEKAYKDAGRTLEDDACTTTCNDSIPALQLASSRARNDEASHLQFSCTMTRSVVDGWLSGPLDETGRSPTGPRETWLCEKVGQSHF